jgi:hypothetical protein
MMQALSDRTLRGASARLLNLRDRGTESLQDVAASGLAVLEKKMVCSLAALRVRISPWPLSRRIIVLCQHSVLPTAVPQASPFRDLADVGDRRRNVGC